MPQKVDCEQYTYAPRETFAKNFTIAAQFMLDPMAIRKNSWKTTIAILEMKKIMLAKVDATMLWKRQFK